MTGLRRFGRLADRAEARRGVVVGNHEQQRGYDDANQRAEIEVHDAWSSCGASNALEGDSVHHPSRNWVEGDRRDDAGDCKPLVERAFNVALLAADREGADDRGDDRYGAQNQRIKRNVGLLIEGQDAKQHHGNSRNGIGLEEVGCHACAVANVVANVVSNNGRVARVILGNSGLDLADEIGADVGGLREDAAAKTGEDGDQRSTETEPDQRVNGFLGSLVEVRGEKAVVASHTEQSETNDEHAGDCAAAECDFQRRTDAIASRLGDTGVGANRNVHADVAGRTGEDAADREANSYVDVLNEEQCDEEDNADCGDDEVLPVEVSAGAFLNGC
ncbi:unannotated protein [freshwater metagenome]|uniref:Unannotated protein n=1 Tax=freshwater metagenome TaxID=449393 RepID=A0A6J5Z671_9ZZZZ